MKTPSKKKLIDIERAAAIFGRSVRVMRDYKRLGIIEPSAKNGMKDLYSYSEVIVAANRISELMLTKKVRDAADVIVRERRKLRKSTRSKGIIEIKRP